MTRELFWCIFVLTKRDKNQKLMTMKTQIKKSQLKRAFQNNEVQSSNLKTFLNRNKYELSQKQLQKVKSWLLDFEIEKQKRNWIESEKKAAKKLRVSHKEYKTLKIKANEILSDFYTGHSMGCYRRLGITNRIVDNYGSIQIPFSFDKDTLAEYARSCTYKPTYGQIRIELTLNQLRKIEKIENIWTIPQPENKCKVLIAKGYKHTYSVNLENYYLIGNSHGKTLREAKLTHLKRTNAEKHKELTDKMFVGFQYFVDKGACRIGINQFCNQHNLNPKHGYNLSYLRELEPTNNWLY